MSELRQNLASKEWVVIAPERGKKPNDFLEKIVSKPAPSSHYDESCPFCPGNEDEFSIIEQQRVTNQAGDWVIRVIDNKYKILDKFNTCPAVPDSFQKEGIYQRLEGCGNHEVIIETNEHSKTIIDLTKDELKSLLNVYVDRYRALKENPNNLLTVIFKNYGILAGQSQPHSHSQIVGSRVVPSYVRLLLHEAEKHFDNFGSCVFCDIVEFEKKHKKRVIYDNKDFISFVPFAASSAHETWIVPKLHEADIGNLSGSRIESLADILNLILSKFHKSIGNPNFNYVFRMSPYPLSGVPFYHWYIQILPRTNIIGGFERGTRIPVNQVVPEESAKMLRKCKTC